MIKYHLYKLYDPLTHELRWIGVTRNPKRRMLDHRSKGEPKKLQWISKLLDMNLLPVMEIVETFTESYPAFCAEAKLLRKHKDCPTLLNCLFGSHSQQTKNRIRAKILEDKSALNRCMIQAEKAKKRVRDSLGRIFESLTDAAKFHDLHRSGIGKICNGDTKLRTLKGMTFEFIHGGINS